MNRLSYFLLFIFTLTAFGEDKPAQKIKDLKGRDMKLLWAEEFNYKKSTPNPRFWSRCERGGADWHNYMSDDPRLVQVKDGKLVLWGVENPDQEKDQVPYLTGGITTKDKFAFKYGKIEIRAKVDSAQGCWPALWLLGVTGQWPANGEIDLMEHLNFDKFVHQTVHSDYTWNIDKTNTPKRSTTAAIDPAVFNTYGAEWDEQSITFTVNGKPTFTYPKVPEKGEKQYPFVQPFYIILSMQIEGAWVGKAEPSQYPTKMEVDWVRVYRYL